MVGTSTGSSDSLPGWVAQAQARWPRLSLGEADFRRHLEALGQGAPAFPTDAYLAGACATGDAAALRVLEDEHIGRVPEMIRRVDPSAAFAADVCQQLRIRLLVREGDAPARIARYTGEVPLSAWMRVIALRLAFNAKRGTRAARPEDGPGEDVAMDDPEADYLRAQYREPFARSLKEAIAGLSKDDRTILRLHYVDGVNIDGIGRVFQVHRATVARWLVRIRSDVLGRAKALLAQSVGAELDEADSVIGVLGGEIDWTLSRALGKGSDGG
jgi:RNA polymerase sigma-70 factor (ECF subfamily)